MLGSLLKKGPCACLVGKAAHALLCCVPVVLFACKHRRQQLCLALTACTHELVGGRLCWCERAQTAQ